MPTLTITKTYQDGQVLNESDLDNIKDDVEAFLNTTKIDNDNIQADGILPTNLDSTVTDGVTLTRDGSTKKLKIKDAGVDTTQLATDAITTVKITDGNVTTAKIADSNITAAKIASSAVTTAKINSAAVTTAKIADDNVTQAKLAAMGSALDISSSSGTFSTSSASFTAVTNLSVSVTTNGRPAVILIQPDGTTNAALIDMFGGGATGEIRITRGGSNIGTWPIPNVNDGSGTDTTASYTIVDDVSAGTYTYAVEVKASGGSALIQRVKLVAYEM